jgi:superfamily II DNA or RNA helicase
MPVDADPHRKIFDPAPDRVVQPLPPGVAPGKRVTVRGRSWRVRTHEPHEDCEELRLESVDAGDEAAVLWPFDRPIPEERPARWRVIRPRTWLRQVRALAAQDRPAVHLATLGASGSGERGTNAAAAQREILPYQLAPALAVAAGVRRVLLADEVGLGKTAQAGWILADLLARQPDARVLIAVPAGLRRQWAHELSRLFAIDSAEVDARWMLNGVSDLPSGVNVWTPPGVYVISIDYLKRPDITASASSVRWDLLVVDEAHLAAAPTERYRSTNAVAKRSRVVVLATATPCSGDDASYASLRAMGAIHDATPVAIFRRSRADVGDGRRRRHRFVRVRITPAEQRLQRMLERYCGEVWAHGPSAEAKLAAIVLRKRALSSASAVERSLRRRQRLLAASASTAFQLTLFGDDLDGEDDEPSGILGAPGMPDGTREQRWLERLVEAARAATAAESKLAYLHRLLRRIGGESAVVFTEFRDTLLDLAAAFPESLRLHGGMTPAERDEVQKRFNAAGGLLFATDAAAHGLNLQGRCRVVVNFELPWNPARLEQRIGRVDRIGQIRVVHAATLVARDTAEDVVIANLARRLMRVARTLGPDDRLAAFLNDARVAGIVIGGEPLPDAAPDSSTAAVAIPADAIVEARRLALDCPAPPAFDVAVSSVAASPALPAGCIVVVQWTLRDSSGRLVACRTHALRVETAARLPNTAAAARETSSALVGARADELQRIAVALSTPHRERDTAAHRASIQARIARELEIEGDGGSLRSVQPGLFDRRALREAAAARSAVDDLHDDAAHAISRLELSAGLEERADIKAVLIVSAHAT